MSFPPLDPVSMAATAAAAMISAGLLLAFVRLARGPSLADRVVALDVIALLVAGLIATGAVLTGEAAMLRPVTVVALLAFLGTVAFARYLERRSRQ